MSLSNNYICKTERHRQREMKEFILFWVFKGVETIVSMLLELVPLKLH